MPWTAQSQKNEAYVSQEPTASVWGEQGSENKVYTKNERFVLVLDNGGERIFALSGFPILVLSVINSLWLGQTGESEAWT